ncbi:alcohol dehydrogenase catalytic domain-containing protein [Nostocoides sp.]
MAGLAAVVGPGVRGLAVGDRVAVLHYSGCDYCSWCRQGLPNHCTDKTV